MSSYYCPYCSPKLQFQIKREDGVIICGQCGDPLIKKPFIKPIQIFAILSAFAFMAPLLMMVFAFIDDQNNMPQKQSPPIGTTIKFI